MRFLSRVLILFALVLVFTYSCKTDFEVYAPEKEIRVVYCILDVDDSVQYVRIAKAFQFEGDAILYASENDLSVKNLDVRLMGNGVVYQAVEMDSVPREPGIFYPAHTLYKIVTDSSGPGKEKLTKGVTYTLEIGTPDAGDYISGVTTIPTLPKLRGTLSLTSGAGNTRCVPKLPLDKEFEVSFDKGNAHSFELRVYFDFFANGEPRSLTWGPTFPFDQNRGCNAGSSQLCYKFGEGELANFFKQYMPAGPIYTYDRSDSCVTLGVLPLDSLAKPLRFQVTAIDEGLTNYMSANDPGFEDLTGTKPEYTNLSGNIEVVGIMGSITKDWKGAIMKDCPEWLLGLNGTPQPPDCQ